MDRLQILLIDDDEDSFLITRGLLAQVQGTTCALKWISSYELGIEELRHNRHDACLLDYRLGARDGLELLHQAVSEGCLTPIIMLTGQGDHEIDLQAMKAGAADFLDKDRLDASRLERSIRYTVERQQLLNALRTSEARFRRLFEANIIGVFFAETDGRITNANNAFLETLGYERSDLPIRWDRRLENAQAKVLDASWQAELRTIGVASPTEQEYRHKNGKPVPVMVGAALLEGDPDHCLGFAVDMSERNRLRELLNQNEKLASIGLLSAGVAHEINNPLAFVANNLAVLRRDVVGLLDLMGLYDDLAGEMAQRSPDSAARIVQIKAEIDWDYLKENLGRLIDSTLDGVRRITRIIQNLRAIASNNPGLPEDASLSSLIDKGLEIVRTRLTELGIKVVVDHQPTPICRCCSTQIVQVVVNLLSNAIEAIRATEGKNPGLIQISSRLENGEFLIEVRDNGCGIAIDDIPHLFDPFFTRRPVGGGMGLGLSLSHRIVTDHGGRIEVESQVGQGSCFTIFLPMANRPPDSDGRSGAAG